MSAVQTGDIVIVQGAVNSNGSDTHPAIVARSWSSGLPGRHNVTLFPDFGSPSCLGSVMIYATEDEAKLSSETIRGWVKPEKGVTMTYSRTVV